jgi:hypothetical protein
MQIRQPHVLAQAILFAVQPKMSSPHDFGRGGLEGECDQNHAGSDLSHSHSS